jgi:hypothetical protein
MIDEGTMAHIFLSYSRRDSAAMERVRDTLRAGGLEVWTDERLKPGTPSWRNAIETAIEGAGAVVVLMSPDSKRSEWVERELSYAAACQVQVFPVLVSGDARRSVPFELSNSQWVDVRHDYGPLSQQLIPALRGHLGTWRPPARVPMPRHAPPTGYPSIMDELARLFRFDLRDTTANRRGKISRRQKLQLFRTETFWLAVGTMVFFLIGESLTEFDRNVNLLICLLAFALGFLTVVAHVLFPKVRWAEGPMQRVRSLNPLTGARVKVGDVKLPRPTNRQQLKAICDTHSLAFRVYYVKTAQGVHFLSVEPFPSG